MLAGVKPSKQFEKDTTISPVSARMQIGSGGNMNVLSCFDGMSAGYTALKRAGIKVDKYYASEVDKYAIQVAMNNHPDIVQLGDIRNVRLDDLEPIDVIIGGSLCQGFSFAGHQLNFDDPRSALFFEFYALYKELRKRNPNVKFFLENVRMSKESEAVITELMGVEPLRLNSSLVSAQNRQRLYWTNIPFTTPVPVDVTLNDILEGPWQADRDKSYCLDASYFKGGTLEQYFEKHRRQLVFSSSGMCQIGIADIRGNDSIKRVYHAMGKGPALTTMQGGHRQPKVFIEPNMWRKLTVRECERCQTFHDNYTEGVSNTQAYKMLGNSWTVDLIVHFFINL